MKNTILVIVALIISNFGISQKLIQSTLPINSTFKNIGIIADVNTSTLASTKKGSIGIHASHFKLYYSFKKNTRKIIFEVPDASQILTTGLNTYKKANNIVEWKLDDKQENHFKLYIATASDSVKNFIVYSGYIYFPALNKWKLIASFKMNGMSESINNATLFKTSAVTTKLEEHFTDIWAQADNGSWNMVQNTGLKKPIIMPMSDVDSANRAINDSLQIQEMIKLHQTDAKAYKNGLYYTLIKSSPNSGIVHITDTVTIFYKGYFTGTDIVFDQTSKEPRTFPLSRLIKGWQIGLDEIRIGEKVKLLIPSGLAYGIRTRSPLISPNSILVFEIEIVDTKPN